jgi:glycosyltransferase involved in cell wall biosynthesis
MLNRIRQRLLPHGAPTTAPRDSHGSSEAAVGYVLMGFPRLSETFIASEILRVERAGVPLRLYVVKPIEEKELGLNHPVADALKARPQYLPEAVQLTKPLRQWRVSDLRPFLPALRRVARERPAGVARAAAGVLHRAVRDREKPWSAPRKVIIKEFFQAAALADALLDAPEVRHLHAHFAHGTTTVTWRAAQMVGLPFSFTGHARDIYAPELNPNGLLRQKLNAATFAVTCTEANVRHLRAIAPDAQIHRIYHGLNAEVAALLDDTPPRPEHNGALQIIGVGRLVEKKGFDVLVEACGELRARGVPFEARIIGQDDKHGAVVRERIATLDLAEEVHLDGPTDQAGLYTAYRAADVVCQPSRLLPNDRDGIPNVLVEAMACGTPVVTTPISAIPELVVDGANGLLVEPDDPIALADALERLHGDRELGERLARNGEDTVRTRFDGDRMAGALAAIFAGAVPALKGGG